jgi:23S rRNA pseudouridine1911/1915/1917 synthase
MTVPPDQDGVLLDAILKEALPEYGLRARRRLWRLRRILVNGHLARPGRRARAGDEILVESAPDDAVLAGGPPDIVAWGNGYVALRKPAGLHTARVAGGSAANLEDFLSRRWMDLWRARRPDSPAPPLPRLVTRLDRETSGLVLGLTDAAPEAVDAFRALEREGRVEKSYLGLIHGVLREPLLIRAGLETRKRRITRILAVPDADATRHTRVTPLCSLESGALGQRGAEFFPGRQFTLIRARILRGSRHQIRAHLAGAGFPLVGDSLYGDAGDAAQRLYLHHAAISLPGFSALDMPGWGLGEEAQFPRGAAGPWF